MKLSKTFCVLPWDHLATSTNGDIIPCCVAGKNGGMNLKSMSFKEAWNSEFMKDVRRKMMKGEEVSVCKRCYVEEAAGIESHRVLSNRHMWPYTGPYEELLEDTTEDGFYYGAIRSLDLRLGNTCNLKCVMCRPHESSKWAGDLAKVASFVTDEVVAIDFRSKAEFENEDYSWAKSPQFWDDVYKLLPKLRDIIMGGGEPFLIKEHNDFLKKCVELGFAQNIEIRVHTNGTVLPDEILELFVHFRQVEIMVSLDGLAEKNHYVRYPSNWANIVSNLDKLDKTPDNTLIFVLGTMHALSVYDFPDVMRWLISRNYKKVAMIYNFSFLPVQGIVHHPSYLSLQVLSPEAKKAVRRRYQEFYEKDLVEYLKDKPEFIPEAIKRLNSTLDYMDQADRSSELGQLRNFIYAIDKGRGTDFEKTFPEWSQILLKQ